MTRNPQPAIAVPARPDLRKPATPAHSPLAYGILQRKCACGGAAGGSGKCDDCEKDKNSPMQRKATGQPGLATAPPIVHETLRSAGQPLDRKTGARMESALGHKFDTVRIHNGEQAGRSAHAVAALAYTVGETVVFASNQFSPNTASGQRLLAHELTHVVQQRSGLTAGVSDQQLEAEADRRASQVPGSIAASKDGFR